MNATANAAGTFTYWTPAGTVLSAGTRMIGVNFNPSTRIAVSVTVWNTLVVNKAAPVTITGGTFTTTSCRPVSAARRASWVSRWPGAGLLQRHVAGRRSGRDPSRLLCRLDELHRGVCRHVPLVINKAVPVVTIAGGPFTFDGQAHPAAVTMRGVGGDPLSPDNVLYDGGPDAPVQGGSHTVTASYSGDANYEAATGDGTLVINKATPIMSLADVTVTYDGHPQGVAATVAGVAGGSLTPVVVTYNGSTTTPTDAGTYTADARYDGNGNYNAVSRTATLRILKALPQLTWTTPASIVHGSPLGAAQLNAASTCPVTSPTPEAGAVLDVGTHTLTASFAGRHPQLRDEVRIRHAQRHQNQPGDHLEPAAGHRLRHAASGAQLNATASVPGTFSCAGTRNGVGRRTQALSVTFTPDDAANYEGAEATVTLNVAKAAPTIMWPFLTAIVYGTPLGPEQLNAAADVPGTFSYSYGPTVFLGAGLRFISVTFTPADAANYSSASATRSLNVNQAPLTIATNSMMKPYGAPLPPFSASAAGLVNFDTLASLAGTLSFATPATAGSAVGTYPVTPFGVSSPNYAIAFVAGTLTVIPGATATSLVASPNPSGFNQAVTLTATVSVMAGAGVPGGAVQFFDGGTLLGAGAARCGHGRSDHEQFVAGSHALSAQYSGDANFTNGTAAAPTVSRRHLVDDHRDVIIESRLRPVNRSR